MSSSLTYLINKFEYRLLRAQVHREPTVLDEEALLEIVRELDLVKQQTCDCEDDNEN